MPVLLVATAWPLSVSARIIAVRMPSSSSINKMVATTARYAAQWHVRLSWLVNTSVTQWCHADEDIMVVNLRSAVGVAMIWLAVVAGASATAWFAIDRAGRDLTGGGISSVSSLSPATPGRTPGSGPLAGATPRPSTSTPQPAAPSTPRTLRPSGSATSPAAATSPKDRSISVAGGQASIRCTGATILLRVAQPDNGWRVEVGESGPLEVELTFERGAEDAEPESHLKAVCANGAPAFTVEGQD
jgi:hypothetical protein